ncbi:FtsX-like permease family protein [Flaviaesturariibacter amylovorans]|uniref:FtsX-like permease family protein n=1 Tax=Flaviaesturariibacter amylovorans TaxID=1084520 RepID=A0ABP8H8H6_9BACT
MNFLFAWRYFKAKKSTNAINIISWISILAILVGAAALILVLSVFNGFEDLVKGLYSSFYPDMRVAPVSGKQITLTAEQLARLRGVPGVAAVAGTLEEKALLQNGDYQSIIYLKGVEESYRQVSGVPAHMLRGEFNLGSAEQPLLVLGAGVENAVGVQSDRNIVPLLVHLPNKSAVEVSSPLNSISADTVNTSGAFLIQQDFDNKYVLTHIGFMRAMMGIPEGSYSALEIALRPGTEPLDAQKALQSVLGKGYQVQTRYEQNASLYAVMRAEKWVIYAILSLILVVAAFNMIGSLTMLVLEKKADITVLHALGADARRIRSIFVSEGLLLALIGGGAGILLALGLALAQIKYKLIPLAGGSFLIDYFPVKLDPWDFLLVAVTILVIALVAAWVPARKAAQQQFGFREE